jgi:hypothetical protein
MIASDEDTEMILLVIWGILVIMVVLNALGCAFCCCCRTFDSPRRVLAIFTGIVLVVALATTFLLTQNIDGLVRSSPHRSLFNDPQRGTRALKRLKWFM